MTARQFMLVFVAVVVCGAGTSCTSDSTGSNVPTDAIQLHGAGATFPAPLYKKWMEEYQKRNPKMRLSYDIVGSGEGIKRFIAGTVDFGASDAAMNDEQMASVGRGVQLIPATAGILVLAYNLEGIGGDLKLKRDVYVDIFLGKIKKWNDSRIEAANPGLHLPSDEIVIVTRQDSSGTTYAFTNHLSTISTEWRDRGPGTGTLINWPGNVMRASGNEGVAGRIKLSRGAIGYVEYGFAERTGLSMAWLENKEGQFIQPSGGSGLVTLLNIPMPDNLRVFVPDPEGKDSYPIVTYSWLLLYKKYDDPQKVTALKQYLKWNLTVGQEFSESLGYIRLPPQVVARATAALEEIQ
ncbi:MAG TPA: phosphate ABC transporter substrate-binding protein PstS [Candidatus Binatia bacterium]|nr:phosphate ABC transporter substrate-binding protein PstS [Candidatus Binatia bacterium]